MRSCLTFSFFFSFFFFVFKGLADKTHHYTLLDGEMIIDKIPDTNKKERRYLIYDMMAINQVSIIEVGFTVLILKIILNVSFSLCRKTFISIFRFSLYMIYCLHKSLCELLLGYHAFSPFDTIVVLKSFFHKHCCVCSSWQRRLSVPYVVLIFFFFNYFNFLKSLIL